jgi:hypothetical protein
MIGSGLAAAAYVIGCMLWLSWFNRKRNGVSALWTRYVARCSCGAWVPRRML